MHPFVADLKAVLNTNESFDYLPFGDWTAGGCGLLAESLLRLVPDSELILVGRLAKSIPDHFLIRVPMEGDWLYVDYDGLRTHDEVIADFRREYPDKADDISIMPAAAFDFDPDDPDALFWYRDSVPGFTRHLERELGPIDLDRLDLAWCDDGPEPSLP
ncbi:MAG: hypothetical protein AWU57_61 [Marinobacter sp. T13-3]|nr:MAG: hypothetical protein AWU57_61 [Marinobacter sp. T13-3]